MEGIGQHGEFAGTVGGVERGVIRTRRGSRQSQWGRCESLVMLLVRDCVLRASPGCAAAGETASRLFFAFEINAETFVYVLPSRCS